jgi:signal transduction histidine kinase
VKVAFHDDGPGITDENVDRLFEPFFTTKEQGTGLGLAIANRIIAAHGGMIEFANRRNGGAEFTVVLPIGGDKSATEESGLTGRAEAAHSPAVESHAGIGVAART